MAQVNTNEFRSGLKILVDNQPHTIVTNDFVKPGKGQAFNRVRLRHLMTGRVVDRNFKSGEKFEIADVNETNLRLLYTEAQSAHFMSDESFEQIEINKDLIGPTWQWLKEDVVYLVIFYNGVPVSVEPPTFIEAKIAETSPGVRGDTASGRVLKPAQLETGALIQVPIFIEADEIVKVDTRTGDYVARVSK